MPKYLPEGMYRNLDPETDNKDKILSAIGSGEILQATATLCDENQNLLVCLGKNLHGIIPKEDTAKGMNDGTTKPISVISRVGKPVTFRVVSVHPGGRIQLSRRSIQEEASRHLLRTLAPGDILPAIVTGMASFGAFCDIGCGVTALLGLQNISISRVPHPNLRFSVGDHIYVAVQSVDRDAGRITLTHKELLGTWEENAALFLPGQTVTGIVRCVQSYGAFIELTPNLTGLAEPEIPLTSGDAVSVYIKSIIPEKAKIKLHVIQKLTEPLPGSELRYFRTEGKLDAWQYGPDSCPKCQVIF